MNKPNTRPVWVTEDRKPDPDANPKNIFIGLAVLAVAVITGVFAQQGIDHTSEPSIMGFGVFLLVTVSVAYTLEKLARRVFPPK